MNGARPVTPTNEELFELSKQCSAGPWRWELNENSKSVQLVGGLPTFDKTVIDFERWGMQNATPRFNDKIEGGQFNIMEPAKKYAVPVPGREHHSDWFKGICHPDAKWIEAVNPWRIQMMLAEIAGLKESNSNAEYRRERAEQKLDASREENNALRAQINTAKAYSDALEAEAANKVNPIEILMKMGYNAVFQAICDAVQVEGEHGVTINTSTARFFESLAKHLEKT